MPAVFVLAQIAMVRHTLSLPSIQLSYLEWGQAGQPPVLLLHGLADNAVAWSSLGEALGTQYHVVAPDLRGHGESSKPDEGYTFADVMADLHGLMDHLGWSSVHVVGHSWGAKFACVWATDYPLRIQSLSLIDPFFIDRFPPIFKLTFPLLYKVLPFLQVMGPFPSYAAAEARAKTLKQYRGWSPLQQQAFQAGMEQKPDGQWGSKFTIAARNQIFDDVLQPGLTQPLDVPTLFVKPSGGLNRFAFQFKPYHTYLKNLQFAEVPGNHWAFLVEPEACHAAIAAFLATLHA